MVTQKLFVLTLILFGLCEGYIGVQSGQVLSNVGFTFSIWSLYAFAAFLLMPIAGFGLILSALSFYKNGNFAAVKWLWLGSLVISLLYFPIIASTVFSVIFCQGYC